MTTGNNELNGINAFFSKFRFNDDDKEESGTSDNKDVSNHSLSDQDSDSLTGTEATGYNFADEALGIEETKIKAKDPVMTATSGLKAERLASMLPESLLRTIVEDLLVRKGAGADQMQVAFFSPPGGNADQPEVLTAKKKEENSAPPVDPEVVKPKANDTPPADKPKEGEKPGAQKDVKAEVKETLEVQLERAKVNAIQPRLDTILANLPERLDKEPTAEDVRKKIEVELAKADPTKRDFTGLSNAELRKAIELEAKEPGFGAQTGFRLTELAYQRANLQLTSAIIDAEILLSKAGLSRMPGDPIGVSTIGTNADNPTEGFAHRPNSFAALFENGDVKIDKVIEMVKSGHIGGGNLILEPKGIPSVSDLNKMDNSLGWINQNTPRLNEARERCLANGAHYIFTDILGVKNKPGWAPPKNSDALTGYNTRMNDVTNLVYRVRNYADCINNLNKAKGDFSSKALEEFEKRGLGKIAFDDNGRIKTFDIKLPDSPKATPENERELQKLRDWLKEFGGPADQLMKEYENANFIRYMDVHQKGTVALDGDRLAAVYDEKGAMTCRVTKDGKVFNRNANGDLIDLKGNIATNEELVDGATEFDAFPGKHFKKNDKNIYVDASGKAAERADFLNAKLGERQETDYFNQKFDIKNQGGKVLISNYRDYYKDHVANYNYWFGLSRGGLTEQRSYNYDAFVVCQNQSGKTIPVRADELGSFKAWQSFYHHGAKFASLALDVGMIVSGGIGAKAALQAGKALYVATNIGRVALGIGGFLDPAFRQMGEPGQVVRQARHYAILFDVTQGLGRQAIGKAFGLGRPLFTSEAAFEVQKVIENSARMHRAEVATKTAFVAADGVWLPLMGSGAKFKVERMRGQNPVEYLDTAAISLGTGSGDSIQNSFAKIVNENPDVAKVAEKLFGAYGPMLGDKGKLIFDQTVAAIQGKNVDPQVQELLKRFHPNHDELMKWKKSHQHKSAERFPKGEQKPETPSEKKELVATAISLLFLSQKDGKLPESGILAQRTVDLEEYKVKAGKKTKTIEAEKITQTITTQDILDILQRGSLDKTDPPTQLVAADALWRAGALPTGRYAGVCLDVINNKDADKETKYKALRQMSDLLVRKNIEETDPSMDPVKRANLDAMDFGLGEENLKEELSKFASGEHDKDLRALATAVLHAHKSRIDEGKEAAAKEVGKKDGEKSDKKKPEESAIAKYDKLWKESAGKPEGTFYRGLVEDLQKQMQAAPPIIKDKTNPAQLAAFDKAREIKILAAETFVDLEKDSKENTALINKTLIDTITLDKTWATDEYDQRPNIALTTRVLDLLIKRGGTGLDENQTKLMYDTARGIIRAKYADVVSKDGVPDPKEPAKAAANTDAAMSKTLVLGQIKDILNLRAEGTKPETYFRESDALRISIVNLLNGDTPWTRHPVMRVAAIKGLVPFGSGLGEENLREIAKSIGLPPFNEASPHVRAAAVRAIANIDNTFFAKSVKYVYPDCKLDEPLSTYLLRKERDPAALDTIWRMHDQAVSYQDPQDVKTIGEYAREVEAVARGTNITISPREIAEFLNSNKSLLKGIDQKDINTEALTRAKKELWSGFGGWLDEVTTSRKTMDAREKQQADNEEAWKVRRERDADAWPNLKNFSKLDKPEMAVKLLMSIVRDDNNLFTQGETPHMRTRAAEYLRDIAAMQRVNGGLFNDKKLLADCVKSALLDSSLTIPCEAKLALLEAVDNLTDRTVGTDVSKGRVGEFSLFTPEEAGLIFTSVLKRENLNYGNLDQSLQDKNEKVQLRCIELIKQHRYLGSFAVLAAKGPTALFDPANGGSKMPQVKAAAQEAVQDLFYGVNWIKEDAKEIVKQRVKTSPEVDAANITARLHGDIAHNGEYVCKEIFASVERNKITEITDARIPVLTKALEHVNPRIRLAAAMALGEATLPPNSEPIRLAVKALTALQYDPGVIENPKRTANAALTALQTIRHGASPNPRFGSFNGVEWMKDSKVFQAPNGTLQDQANLLKETVKSSEYVFANPDPTPQRLKPEDLKPNSPFFNLLKTLIEKQERDKGNKPEPVEVERLATEKMEKLKKADQADRNRATGETFADKRMAEEDLAVKMFASFKTNKIETEADPRREVLKDLLKHKSERVALAAALIMSESKITVDREMGVERIAEMAMHYGTNYAEAIEHLVSFVADKENRNGFDSKAETLAVWNRVFERNGGFRNPDAWSPQSLIQERLRPPPPPPEPVKIEPVFIPTRRMNLAACHGGVQEPFKPGPDLTSFFDKMDKKNRLSDEDFRNILLGKKSDKPAQPIAPPSAPDRAWFERAAQQNFKAEDSFFDKSALKCGLISDEVKMRYQSALLIVTSPKSFDLAAQKEAAQVLAIISITQTGDYKDSAARAVAALPEALQQHATASIQARLSDKNESVQFESVKYLVQSSDKSITDTNKKAALAGLGQLSASSDAVLAEKARNVINAAPDKQVAIASALDAIAAKLSRETTDDEKQSTNKNLAALAPLIENLPYSQEVESRLFGMIDHIDKAGDSNLLKVVRNYLNKPTSEKPPIKDVNDPRVGAMRKALAAKDSDIKFSAIRGLLDTRNENISEAAHHAARTLGVMSITESGDSGLKANETLNVLPDAQRLHAISGKASCMVTQPEAIQYEAAVDILSSSDELVDSSHRNLALRTMGRLLVSSNSDLSEKAGQYVEASSDKAFPIASAVQTLDSRISMARNDESKADAYRKLAALSTFIPQCSYAEELEARLYAVANHIETTNARDLLKAARDYIDRRDPEHSKSAIKSAGDARIKPMTSALDAKDSGIKLSAAIALLDPRNEGVPKDVQELARHRLFASVKKSFSDVKDMEKNPNSDSKEIVHKLDELEKILQYVGEKDQDYALNYVRMLKFERTGGQESQLTAIYERLAEISKERGATDAVRMFNSKAERAKFACSDDVDIKHARTAVQTANDLAGNALKTMHQKDLDSAETKFKDSIEALRKLYGKEHVIVADALSSLATFYAQQGKYELAEKATEEAVPIYDKEQISRLPRAPQRDVVDQDRGNGKGAEVGKGSGNGGTAIGSAPSTANGGAGVGSAPGTRNGGTAIGSTPSTADGGAGIGSAPGTGNGGTAIGSTPGAGAGTGPGPGSGPDRGSKLLAGKRFGGEKKEFALDNKEVLHDLVDFVASTRAIGDDATRDAREVSDKQRTLQMQVYGANSPKYADALIKSAKFRTANYDGPPTDAQNMYQEAANIFGQAGDFGKQADATADLGMLHKNMGQFDQAERILENGLQQLERGQNTVADKRKVANYLKTYLEVAISKGDEQLIGRVHGMINNFQMSGGRLIVSPGTGVGGFSSGNGNLAPAGQGFPQARAGFGPTS